MKKTVIGVLIFALILIQASVVFGATEHSFNATLYVDGSAEETIDPGDEITVTFGIANIDMGTNGINTVEATLEYDTDSFETVSSSDITSTTNWATTYNSANGKLLVVTFDNGVKEDTQLFTLTMKAKTTLPATKLSQIKLVDITSNDGDELISTGTKAVGVTINVPVPDTTNEVVDNTINTTVVEPETTVPTTTQAPTPIPQTGISPVVAVVIAISVGLIVVTCVRYKLISKDVK